MVSVGQMVGLILAIVVPMMVGIILFLHIKKETKVKGLVFTMLYGVAGYLWEAWIYVMAYGWVGAMMMSNTWFETAFGSVVGQMLIALVYALLTAGGLYWAIYLSNMHEINEKRGTAVGLGFGMAYTVWNYVLIYGTPLIVSFQMRFGTFAGDSETEQKVIGLSVENMYLFIIDTVIFILIMVGTTLVMSHYFISGKKLMMFAVPLTSQFLIKFLNGFLPTIMPDVASAVIYNVAMGVVAVYCLWMLFGYLKSSKVYIKPGVELK